MDTKKEIRVTDQVVREILREYPYTRDSDELLYYEVIHKICKRTDLSAYDVFVLRDAYGLPCFETVRRTRQFVQAEDDTLRGSIRGRKTRSDREKLFKAYAIGGVPNGR